MEKVVKMFSKDMVIHKAASVKGYKSDMYRRAIHLMLLLLVLPTAFLSAQPAAFVRDLAVPSGGTPIVRPADIYVDPLTHELYVADAGNGRIVIFDAQGRFDFAFTDPEHLTTPKQIAVDSMGHIFVLAESQGEKLTVFDYDGTFLRDLPLKDPSTGKTLSVVTFTMDAQDRIFAATCQPVHLWVLRADGTPLYDVALFTDLDKEARDQQMLGSLSIINGDLIIPMPTLASVARCTLDGKLVRAFGISGGGGFGELAFPVAAASDGQGGILVLDRMRHTILQFRDDGTYVQERGGFGESPGWFYMPNSLAAGPDGLCYVGQWFNNRIQGVRLTAQDSAPEGIAAAGRQTPSISKTGSTN
jgi:sugar lactone lactonase YvrE